MEVDDWNDFDNRAFVADITLFEIYFAISRACYARACYARAAIPLVPDCRQLEFDFRPLDRGPPYDHGLPPAAYDHALPPPVYEAEDVSSTAQDRRLTAVAVVFAALTLEAFINSYMKEHLGDDLVELLDRIPIKEKWNKIPKLICLKELPKGRSAMNAVTKLFKLRDRLVHAKPKTVVFSSESEPSDQIDDARGVDPVALVYSALNGLKEIDSSIDIEWAYRCPRTQSWEHFI